MFYKEINHSSTCNQYSDQNSHLKSCMRVVSTMTRKSALVQPNRWQDPKKPILSTNIFPNRSFLMDRDYQLM